jgi:glucose/sorbosone dehydrogenase
MESLTGLPAYYWLLLFCFLLGLTLVVESRRREFDGIRVRGMLVAPLVAGAMLAVFLIVGYRDDTRYLLSHITDRAGSLPVALATLLAAAAFADLFFARFAVLAMYAFSRLSLSSRRRGDLSLAFGVGVPTAIVLAILPGLDRHFNDKMARNETLARAGGGPFQADYRIPGQPLDIVIRKRGTSGYVSFGQGSIARLDLPKDPTHEPHVTTLARGLQYPRGLAVVGRTLFVSELGPLPCRPSFPSCKGGDVEGETVDETERNILRTSRGRVLAFHIQDDGSLSNRRVIIENLPVVNTDHGLNDIERGPDGLLYLAIGNLDAIYKSHKLTQDLKRPHADLLGTIVSFQPDGGGLRIYARGLRNVYGLTFDPHGHLYGSDNSGPTRHGYRREELLTIERGADYGYPDAPRRASTPPPLRILQAHGSGGIAWVPDTAGAGRLILGNCGGLDSVPLKVGQNGEPRVAQGARVKHLRDLPGCVTAIGARPGGLVVTLFTSGARGKVYLVPTSG